MSEIVEQARKYLGTPYKSQGRDKSGIDCGGFCVLVFRSCGYEIEDIFGYPRIPDGETFEKILLSQCGEVTREEICPGDILAFSLQNKEMVSHIGICSQIEPYIKIIHCLESGGMRGVVEHRLMPGTVLYRNWIKSYRIK